MHTLRLLTLSSALLCATCAPSPGDSDSGTHADAASSGANFAFMVTLEWRSASTIPFSWTSSNGVALFYDVSSDPSAPCSAAARAGRNGTFALPAQMDMSPNGGHTLLINESAISNYHGPGTYSMPDAALAGTVDDEAFDGSGQTTTATVNANGSGSATTTGTSATTHGPLTMTMTWTCVNR